jgi:hypothetical protein
MSGTILDIAVVFPETAMNDWAYTKSWLRWQLSTSDGEPT